MSWWQWVLALGAVVLVLPVALVALFFFVVWWLDQTVGRLMDRWG